MHSLKSFIRNASNAINTFNAKNQKGLPINQSALACDLTAGRHTLKALKQQITSKKIWLFGAVSTQLLLSACSTTTPAPVTTRPGAPNTIGGYPSGYPSNIPSNIPNTGLGVGAYPTTTYPAATYPSTYPVNNIGNAAYGSEVQIQPYPYPAQPTQPNLQPQPYYNIPYAPPKPAPAVVPINSNLNPNLTPAAPANNAFNAPQVANNLNEPVPAGYYRAMPGDTLYKIARANNIQPRDLLAWNNLENPNQLNIYQLVRVTPPYASNTGNINNNASSSSSSNASVNNQYANTNPITPITPTASNNNSLSSAPSLIWPIKNGRVVKKFDQKSIEMTGREGDVVFASEDGKVLFANTMRGYGKLVVISHNPELVTAYANLGHIAVRDQQMVKKGQTIGLINAPAGSNEAPRLQFQVRKSGKAVDPLAYLPK